MYIYFLQITKTCRRNAIIIGHWIRESEIYSAFVHLQFSLYLRRFGQKLDVSKKNLEN